MRKLSFSWQVIILVVPVIFTIQCQSSKKDQTRSNEPGSFGYDVNFLSKYQKTILLHSDDGKASVLVCPAYQGRVMTSSADGNAGTSFGWINHKLIASREKQQKINAYGGEDRFWLGPEGGQFSIFFKPGSEFIFKDWSTPEVLDTQPFELVSSDQKRAVFTKSFQLENYSKTKLDVRVDRTIAMLDDHQIEQMLGMSLNNKLKVVGFRTENEITNTGDEPWTKERGALSIWILGMYNPSPVSTIVIPYKSGPESELGPVLNDAYFGKVADDRLVIADSVIFFKADGKQRGKIGISPYRAMAYLGSYDELNKVLTIIHFTTHEDTHDYVNSMWNLQDEPFAGDVANAYNDGPVDGQIMGPFFELESSSPAAFLEPGEHMKHEHTTVHLQGDTAELDKISREVLGAGLNDIIEAF